MARSIANSPLVKAALHGGDPNFGRILQAAGQAWPDGEPFVADLEVQGLQLVSAGEIVVEPDDLPEIAKLVRGNEIEYSMTIPGEGGETEVFFSDLSTDYGSFTARTSRERRRHPPRGASHIREFHLDGPCSSSTAARP